MLSKNEIKYIQSLGHKKNRDAEKLFIAEGPKLVDELIKSHFTINTIYATTTWIAEHPQNSIPVTEVAEHELQKISVLRTSHQVLAIVTQKPQPAPPLLTGNLTLYLDGIQDPGNMGTIIRTCDWFGVTQLVCSIDCVEIYNPKVVQATMGSLARVNFWEQNIGELLKGIDIPVYGAMLSGKSVFKITNATEGVLIMGNEGNGIRSEIQSFINHPVTIPKVGGAESLNVAMATGIILGCFTNL
jgi:RNA methyltransferase, TrmH family